MAPCINVSGSACLADRVVASVLDETESRGIFDICDQLLNLLMPAVNA